MIICFPSFRVSNFIPVWKLSGLFNEAVTFSWNTNQSTSSAKCQVASRVQYLNLLPPRKIEQEVLIREPRGALTFEKRPEELKCERETTLQAPSFEGLSSDYIWTQPSFIEHVWKALFNSAYGILYSYSQVLNNTLLIGSKHKTEHYSILYYRTETVLWRLMLVSSACPTTLEISWT